MTRQRKLTESELKLQAVQKESRYCGYAGTSDNISDLMKHIIRWQKEYSLATENGYKGDKEVYDVLATSGYIQAGRYKMGLDRPRRRKMQRTRPSTLPNTTFFSACSPAPHQASLCRLYMLGTQHSATNKSWLWCFCISELTNKEPTHLQHNIEINESSRPFPRCDVEPSCCRTACQAALRQSNSLFKHISFCTAHCHSDCAVIMRIRRYRLFLISLALHASN